MNSTVSKVTKRPILMIIVAVSICSVMVRLGFWQLDRAGQKRELLNQAIRLSELPTIDIKEVLVDIKSSPETLRYRQVSAQGHYLSGQSILIDNQVLNSKVG